jgi:phosphohistidine phosphatase SixA
MADTLVGETRDVMLVGHMPHIERLFALLVGGSSNGAAVFPRHGIVALTLQNHRWVECWRLEDGDPGTSATQLRND